MEETEKLTRKEKRLRWKEAKRARRQAEKDYYRYAPWLKRVWNLYLKKPCGTIIVLAVIIGLLSSLFPAFLQETVVPLLYAFNSANKDSPLDEAGMEKLYEISPLDAEGAARIDALPAVGEDETWTICVYLVGSNLEDMDTGQNRTRKTASTSSTASLPKTAWSFQPISITRISLWLPPRLSRRM